MALKILLVDDSRVVRNVIKVHLMGMAIEFVEANNGEEALEALRRTAVDLVISDIEMPRMDGITMLKKIRTGPRVSMRGLPVILLTAADELKAKALEAGATDFVRKPVASANLLEVIRKYLPEATRRSP